MCINHRPTRYYNNNFWLIASKMKKKICNKSDTASKNNKQSRFNSFAVSWFPLLAIPWLATSPSDHVSQNSYWEKSNFMNVRGALLQTHNDCPQNFPFNVLSKPTNKFSKVRLLPVVILLNLWGPPYGLGFPGLLWATPQTSGGGN